ncbi:MAG: fused MFS/spermidine synthase, partial [Myxococcota bacterium]
MSREGTFPLLLVCFFLSGLAALVYETAWTREFAAVFGTSNLAVATVLAAYMGGLAAGAAVAGRLSSRIRRPVLLYGVLELGIALSALAIPLAIQGSRVLYVSLFGGSQGIVGAGGAPTALFYLVCSFLILLVPTSMMGATLPLLARHAVRSEEEIGRRIAVLYAVNTAGAVAGTLLAAFVLVPSLGLRLTIWAAAGINALVFLTAWLLARRAPPLTPEPPGAGAAIRGLHPILLLILVSGAVSFSYEILWSRLLAHVVGSSMYAFATMLGSFLMGIALGSAAAARFATGPQRAAQGFAVAQLGIALLSLAAYAGVEGIPELARLLEGSGVPDRVIHAVAGMLTLFPAALFIGATFPFAVRVLATGARDAAPATARIYTANTLGSIVGSLAAGFLLVPALGYGGTLA